MLCGQYLYVKSFAASLSGLPKVHSGILLSLPSGQRVSATGESPKIDNGVKFWQVSVNTHELTPLTRKLMDGMARIYASENRGWVTGWCKEVDLSRSLAASGQLDDGKPIDGSQAFSSSGAGIRA
jgi:hypothetical protein